MKDPEWNSPAYDSHKEKVQFGLHQISVFLMTAIENTYDEELFPYMNEMLYALGAAGYLIGEYEE